MRNKDLSFDEWYERYEDALLRDFAVRARKKEAHLSWEEWLDKKWNEWLESVEEAKQEAAELNRSFRRNEEFWA